MDRALHQPELQGLEASGSPLALRGGGNYAGVEVAERRELSGTERCGDEAPCWLRYFPRYSAAWPEGCSQAGQGIHPSCRSNVGHGFRSMF